MSDPRAFISFDVDHNSDEKVLFAGQSKNSKTPFSIQDWSAKSSMPQSQWEAIVKEKIGSFSFQVGNPTLLKSNLPVSRYIIVAKFLKVLYPLAFAFAA